MKFENLLDPELVPAFNTLPDDRMLMIGDNPIVARESSKLLFAQMAKAVPPTNVTIEERTIAGSDGNLKLYIYQPMITGIRPALLWIHGGGFLLGEGRDDVMAIPFAEQVGCTVISVDYRLAPEHPFPAAVEDCYTALLWSNAHAEELEIDPNRIAIGGASAGGGIAAGVALMNRDKQGPKLKFQLLLYAMLDNTHSTVSGHAITHPKVWNRDVSLKAWRMYLGNSNASDISPYAAPARATDTSNLPATYICVGSLDLFRDENIEYASRLLAAEVPTELQVFPGCFHASEIKIPTAMISQRMRQAYIKALVRAFINF